VARRHPPATEEFKKLIALRRGFDALGEGGPRFGAAREDLLALLPRLRDVFGPAFPNLVHEHLDAIEADLRAGRCNPEAIGRRARAVTTALGC
jgi:hypothetical protein